MGGRTMSFFDSLEKAKGEFEDFAYKKIAEQEKRINQILRRKSDAEMERIYRNRYNYPNLNSFQIRLIEEEADRRGIS